MPTGVVHELADLRDGPDAAARAERRAVQRGRGAGKLQDLIEGLACEQGKRESGVEDVAGAGGVDGFDHEGRAVVKRAAVPGEGAVAAEGGAGDAAAEAPVRVRVRRQEYRRCR